MQSRRTTVLETRQSGISFWDNTISETKNITQIARPFCEENLHFDGMEY
jgi:hypothetical protein